MKATMERLLHTHCEETEFTGVGRFPLFLRGPYQFKLLQVLNIHFIAAEPREKINFATMRKHHQRIMELTGMECVFQMDGTSAYAKNKMLEEGIPFVLTGKEIYLPFMGIALSGSETKKQAPKQLSFMTQKLLLTVLYKEITAVTVTEIAKELSVSKMTGTRCFDELDAYNLGLIEDNKTAGRYFKWNKGKKDLWALIRPILRNPVEKQIYLDCQPPWPLPLSGMSAISHFSMLADNAYPTYAVSKKALKNLQPEKLPQIPQDEIPAAIIQVMGYDMLCDEASSLVIDPLSAVLSLTQEEMDDPRIEGAVEEIMEEFL